MSLALEFLLLYKLTFLKFFLLSALNKHFIALNAIYVSTIALLVEKILSPESFPLEKIFEQPVL